MAKLTAEDKKKIIELRLEKGTTLSKLSIMFGITETNIFKLINKYKIHGDRIFEKRHRTFTPEIKMEVISRVKHG